MGKDTRNNTVGYHRRTCVSICQLPFLDGGDHCRRYLQA